MPKIDWNTVRTRTGTSYPAPFHEPCVAMARQHLGEASGLTQFGVILTRLAAGAWSSQRHWHSAEDEFIYVLEGELVLVTDSGEEVIKAGDCAGFKAGAADGHHLQNRSANAAVFLAVGTRSPQDVVVYPDIDLIVPEGSMRFSHRNGEPYS